MGWAVAEFVLGVGAIEVEGSVLSTFDEFSFKLVLDALV